MTKPQATTIGPKKLMDLLNVCRNHQSDMDTVRGDLGNAIAQAVEKDGLDRKVFSLIRRLDKLSPEKLAAWSETFDDYFVKSGLKRRAESAPRFQLEEGENEADEQVQEQAAAEKPKRGRKPKNGSAEGEEGSAGLPH